MGAKEELLLFVNNQRPILCYGAGDYGRQIHAFLRSRGILISFFVESKPCECREKFGIRIVSLDEISNCRDYIWIISVSQKYKDEILTNLKYKGIKDYFCISDELITDIRNDTLIKNVELKGYGNGKRCFILGTGPSIKHQNLKLLKDEEVFSCSWCNLFNDYDKISPEFYFAPAIMGDPTRSEKERDEYGMEAYRFRDETIKSSIIVLDYKDKAFVESVGAFKGKKVYYLDQMAQWNEQVDCCDICGRTPQIQTATIMMLKVAIYMGYNKIYLLGTEHDIIKRNYEHSYDINRLRELGYDKLYEISTFHGGLVEKEWPMREVLRVSYEIFKEYYLLHKVAKTMGVEIYNATNGGDLDEFLRVEYEQII